MALMSLKNLTIGINDDGISTKIDNTLNKITGSLGFFLDRLLVHKNKRVGILKSVPRVGDDSFESLSHLISNNLLDLHSLPLKSQYDNEYLERTKVTSIQQYQLGQFLLKPTKFQQTDLSSFLFENKNLLLLILIGYCIISLFNFINYTNCEKIKILKIKFYNLLFLNDNQLNFLSFKFSLMKLFFDLFLFTNLNLLKNTIKTDKIIVRTDHFLNTDHKLFETKKKFVFGIYDEKHYRLSAKTSLIYRLYQKKVNEKNYFSIPDQSNKKANSELLRKETELLIKELESSFMISSQIYLLYSIAYLSSFSQGKEFTYLNDHNYFEAISQFYLRKSLNEKIKNKIHWGTNQYFENGIYLEFESNLFNELYKNIDRNAPIIFNVKQYIDQQSINSSFGLENFKTIFNLYILILFIIWLIFIVNSNYKKIFWIISIFILFLIKSINYIKILIKSTFIKYFKNNKKVQSMRSNKIRKRIN